MNACDKKNVVMVNICFRTIFYKLILGIIHKWMHQFDIIYVMIIPSWILSVNFYIKYEATGI